MDKFINLRLMSHPINWVTVFFMVLIAGIFGHLVLSYFGVEPSTPHSGYSDLPAGLEHDAPFATTS